MNWAENSRTRKGKIMMGTRKGIMPDKVILLSTRSFSYSTFKSDLLQVDYAVVLVSLKAMYYTTFYSNIQDFEYTIVNYMNFFNDSIQLSLNLLIQEKTKLT